MSKAILVLDMPESCDKCSFHYNTYDENDCYVDKCELLDGKTIDGYTKVYDECPLREIPMGIDAYVPEDMDYYSYRRGWYDCKSAFLDR